MWWIVASAWATCGMVEPEGWAVPVDAECRPTKAMVGGEISVAVLSLDTTRCWGGGVPSRPRVIDSVRLSAVSWAPTPTLSERLSSTRRTCPTEAVLPGAASMGDGSNTFVDWFPSMEVVSVDARDLRPGTYFLGSGLLTLEGAEPREVPQREWPVGMPELFDGIYRAVETTEGKSELPFGFLWEPRWAGRGEVYSNRPNALLDAGWQPIAGNPTVFGIWREGTVAWLSSTGIQWEPLTIPDPQWWTKKNPCPSGTVMKEVQEGERVARWCQRGEVRDGPWMSASPTEQWLGTYVHGKRAGNLLGTAGSSTGGASVLHFSEAGWQGGYFVGPEGQHSAQETWLRWISENLPAD